MPLYIPSQGKENAGEAFAHKTLANAVRTLTRRTVKIETIIKVCKLHYFAEYNIHNLN